MQSAQEMITAEQVTNNIRSGARTTSSNLASVRVMSDLLQASMGWLPKGTVITRIGWHGVNQQHTLLRSDTPKRR
jgi:hypothetical protein